MADPTLFVVSHEAYHSFGKLFLFGKIKTLGRMSKGKGRFIDQALCSYAMTSRESDKVEQSSTEF